MNGVLGAGVLAWWLQADILVPLVASHLEVLFGSAARWAA